MTTSLYLADDYAERSRLEHGIRAYEFLLQQIDEDRIQFEVQLAECSLIRRLLIARQHAPRTRTCNPVRAQSRTFPKRDLNREHV